MKGKLIITVGMSNSGKSRFASTLVQAHPDDYIRVNRDDIRALLYGYTDETVEDYYLRDDIHKLEKQVTRFEDSLIYDALELGKTVIVDATHLKKEYLERFKYWNVPINLEFFDISLGEAFKRNDLRMRKVDGAIMKKQYAQYQALKAALAVNPIDFTPIVLNNDKSKRPAIVFDIDGTLAHKGDRSAYDWHKVGEDTVDKSIAFIAKMIKVSGLVDVIIATGRDGVSLEETEKWLEKYKIPYNSIYIRPKGDMRSDWLVKKEMAEEIVKQNHIAGWFDDRLQVSRHLRMLGLNVYNVAHGNF